MADLLLTSPAHCAARGVLRWPRPLHLAVDRCSRPDRHQSTTRTSSYCPKHRAIPTAGFPRSIRHTRPCCKRRKHSQCLATRSIVAIPPETESRRGKEAFGLIRTSPEYEHSAWGTAFAQHEQSQQFDQRQPSQPTESHEHQWRHWRPRYARGASPTQEEPVNVDFTCREWIGGASSELRKHNNRTQKAGANA